MVDRCPCSTISATKPTCSCLYLFTFCYKARISENEPNHESGYYWVGWWPGLPRVNTGVFAKDCATCSTLPRDWDCTRSAATCYAPCVSGLIIRNRFRRDAQPTRTWRPYTDQTMDRRLRADWLL